MDDYSIGDVVRITGDVMRGSVGTVVWLDHEREKYLVRVSAAVQNFFSADDLEFFSA